MKRYPLLIQLIVYVFVFILLLLGLVGSLYYQTSSATIGQLTERTTRNSIEQSSQFITSYLKKLKQTTSVLSKEESIRQFAQDKEVSPEAVQSLMRTIIETDPDLVSAVLVTKDGRLVATDSQISMQTSSDMMNESWYQEAIKERGIPVLTPARKESLSSEKDKWVISITQEVVDASGQNLGVLRLDIGYQSLEAYLDHLQLGKKALVSSSIRSMNLSTILKRQSILPVRKCRPCNPILLSRMAMPKRGRTLSSKLLYQRVIGP